MIKGLIKECNIEVTLGYREKRWLTDWKETEKGKDKRGDKGVKKRVC